MQEPSHRKNPPWWVWVFATAFLLDFGLVLRGDWTGPTLGFIAVYNQGSVLVTTVYADADTIPFRPGDRIIRADGHWIGSDSDWFVILSNLRVGITTTFEVDRDKQHLQLSVTPSSRSAVRSFIPGVLTLLRIGQMMMLGVACFVVFTRPKNSLALLTALFFGSVSFYNAPTTISGFAPIFHAMPIPIRVLLFLTTAAVALGPLWLFLFCVSFPRGLIRPGWIVPLCAPMLVLSVPELIYSYRLVHNPDRAFGMFPEWFYLVVNFTSAAYSVAGPVALALNYRTLTDINERRRVRVLVLGAVAGLFALAILILAIGVPPFRDGLLGRIVLAPITGGAFVIIAFLLFPAAFAYAVLRHRLFDVRIMIRQGIQYAMARGVLLSALPVLSAAFLLDVFIHRQESFAAIVATRGLTYVVLGSVTAVLYWKRQEWLDRIDRRFFRDRYDAHRLLQQVVLDVKETKSLEQAAGEVVKQIHHALHPEFVALLYRRENQWELRSLACAPANHKSPEIPVSGKVMAFLRLVERPVQLSTSSLVTEALHGDEINLVREHRIDLIVPITVVPDHPESLLVLGPKLSEEPYSHEDEKLLSAIAANLALLAASTRPADADRHSFQECPRCGGCFSTTKDVCSEDRSALVLVQMPQMLAKRYKLQRRIGRGGMGSVYSGTDEALERRIAIKVIRPDLIGQGDLRNRFHREARAAAGLMHRNVITIYDFGIERQHPFIVMELLSGRTLRDELRRSKNLSAGRTLEILEGVCAAIEEAHRHQFLHRDIKPENIFLADTPTGEVVKVLDFGLAKGIGISTVSSTITAGNIAGTLCYMAPEQLFGNNPGPPSDVWAIGVVAYEMLTGAQPFTAATVAGWQQALQGGRFTPLNAYQPNLNSQFESVFERVLERDPIRRTASARSLLSELQAVFRNDSGDRGRARTG
jgi:tRNA A-37 threonylcarbamoyl transferase component Bud32